MERYTIIEKLMAPTTNAADGWEREWVVAGTSSRGTRFAVRPPSCGVGDQAGYGLLGVDADWIERLKNGEVGWWRRGKNSDYMDQKNSETRKVYAVKKIYWECKIWLGENILKVFGTRVRMNKYYCICFYKKDKYYFGAIYFCWIKLHSHPM